MGKLIGVSAQILNLLKELSLGKFYSDIALSLRQSIFLPVLLLNSETWFNMTNKNKLSMLREMVDLTEDFKNALEDEDLNSLGKLLNYNWELKKQLASNISNPKIDLMYQEALRKGAVGGKLLGAGGAGFLMIMAFDHKPIQNVLNCKSIGLKIDQSGTRIINSDHGVI